MPAIGWLLLAGPLTAIPLLLFAAGARRIPLTTLGILQYISPSLQFALGVWPFGETLQASRLLGFGLIWMALVIYSLEGWLRLPDQPSSRPRSQRAKTLSSRSSPPLLMHTLA